MSTLRQHIVLRDFMALVLGIAAQQWIAVGVIAVLSTYDLFRKDFR